MRSTASGLLAFVCALVVAGSAHAQIANGSFEQGFNGYATIGNVSIVSADFGVVPTDGQSQALLTTGVGAVPTAEIESFLGLAPGSIAQITTSGPTQGSAISMLIQAPPGVQIQFDFNYLTSEFPGTSFNDASFFMVMGNVPTLLADTRSMLAPSPTRFGRETGYTTQTVTIEMPASGMQLLSFGIVDVLDTAVDSGLLIDDVKILNQPPDCSAALADPEIIRFQDGKLRPVAIAGVVDPDGDELVFKGTLIQQNEPVRFRGTGVLAPDATLDPIQVRAGRDLGGSGRIYLVDFQADDGKGGTCAGSVRVCVPRSPFFPICDGPLYDSTEKPSLADLVDSIINKGEAADLTESPAPALEQLMDDVAAPAEDGAAGL